MPPSTRLLPAHTSASPRATPPAAISSRSRRATARRQQPFGAVLRAVSADHGARREGAALWDVDGHRYADFIAEYTAGVYGHSAPEIREAVTEAMQSGINLTGHNLLEGRLGKAYLRAFSADRAVALHQLGHRGEPDGADRRAALHGAPQDRGVCGRLPRWRAGLRRKAAADHGAVRFPGAALQRCADGARRRCERHGAEIAAVLVEPMQGASGCIPGSLAFLQALRELWPPTSARLLVFDEVMTSRLAPHGLANTAGHSARTSPRWASTSAAACPSALLEGAPT